MIAALPMYWRDETAQAWRGFWRDVQQAWQQMDGMGTQADLPPLTEPNDLPDDWTEHWCDPNLILSQTCSLPLRSALRDKVTYVGTFDFGLDTPDIAGPPGSYHSVFIGQPGGPVQTPPNPTRFAVNGFDSQSGWAAAPAAQGGAAQAQMRFVKTGSHAASLAAVAENRADGAALDAVTWRILQRHDPKAQHVRVTGHSAPTPGLPMITAQGSDPAPLRAALTQACASSAWMGHPDLGGMQGFVVLDPDAYLQLPLPDPPAQSAII